jgi:ribosomal protein L11 methyltransferase
MKPKTLWRISIAAPVEAEAEVAGLLERAFAEPVSIYVADGQQVSVATVYTSQDRSQIEAKREAVEAELALISSFRRGKELGKIIVRKVRQEDWSTSWKKHFKPIAIGSALLIKPSWSKRKPRPGQAVVTLDPGLSFGTGQHPTTGFCLNQLAASRQTGQVQSFLDIGTGSGILAIAAAKLGYHPVCGIDNDATAVRVAVANARLNGVYGRVNLVRRDLASLPVRSRDRYDVICANLVQDLLLEHADRIINRLRRGGKLVVAGLLVRQFGAIRNAFMEKGLKLQAAAVEREWKSGMFSRE